MFFHHIQKQYPNIKINNIEINHVSQYIFLGIILSADLKWKKHIDHISMKISKVIAIMYRLKDIKRFVDILETFDFVQHIDKPTHNSGQLFDYIITRKDSSGVSNLYVSDFISDHRALHVSLACSRAHPERKQIEVR